MLIAQITDLHLNDFLAAKFNLDTCSNIEIIFSDLAAKSISRLVITGDLGSIEKINWLENQLFKKHNFEVDTILGNHDKIELIMNTRLVDLKNIQDGEYYFSKIINEHKVLFIDTSKSKISDKQLLWIEEQVENHENVIIFSHHPILNCNTAMDKAMAMINRDELTDVLKSTNKKVTIFCGHYHSTHLINQNNITQYVCPACIMQVFSQDDKIKSGSFDFGYRIIEILDEGVSTETNMFISSRKVQENE